MAAAQGTSALDTSVTRAHLPPPSPSQRPAHLRTLPPVLEIMGPNVTAKPFVPSRSLKASSAFRGVSAQGARWRARICVNKVEYTIGDFATQEEAARAYDIEAIKRGKIRNLNYIYKGVNDRPATKDTGKSKRGKSIGKRGQSAAKRKAAAAPTKSSSSETATEKPLVSSMSDRSTDQAAMNGTMAVSPVGLPPADAAAKRQRTGEIPASVSTAYLAPSMSAPMIAGRTSTVHSNGGTPSSFPFAELVGTLAGQPPAAPSLADPTASADPQGIRYPLTAYSNTGQLPVSTQAAYYSSQTTPSWRASPFPGGPTGPQSTYSLRLLQATGSSSTLQCVVLCLKD